MTLHHVWSPSPQNFPHSTPIHHCFYCPCGWNEPIEKGGHGHCKETGDILNFILSNMILYDGYYHVRGNAYEKD